MYHFFYVFNYSDLTVVAFGRSEYVFKLPILNALTQFMIQNINIILCLLMSLIKWAQHKDSDH